jgi:hypothetical protein
MYEPGWTADAALSPSPVTLSPALSRVDFWESGVADGRVSYEGS